MFCCLAPAFNRSMFRIRSLPGAARCGFGRHLCNESSHWCCVREAGHHTRGPAFLVRKKISKHWAISPRNSQKHRDFVKSRGEERQNWDLSKTMVIFRWFRTSTPFQSHGWAWFRHVFLLETAIAIRKKKGFFNARRPTACGSWCWAIRAVWARRLGGILWRICVCAIHWWWLGEKPLNTRSQSALNFAASCTSVHCFCIWSQTILQYPPIPWLCIDSFGDFRRQAWVLQPYFQSRWYRSLGPNRTDSLQFPPAASCPLELWLICSQLAKLKPDFLCSQNQPKSSSRL